MGPHPPSVACANFKTSDIIVVRLHSYVLTYLLYLYPYKIAIRPLIEVIASNYKYM
jgi:hypothetical protein